MANKTGIEWTDMTSSWTAGRGTSSRVARMKARRAIYDVFRARRRLPPGWSLLGRVVMDPARPPWRMRHELVTFRAGWLKIGAKHG